MAAARLTTAAGEEALGSTGAVLWHGRGGGGGRRWGRGSATEKVGGHRRQSQGVTRWRCAASMGRHTEPPGSRARAVRQWLARRVVVADIPRVNSEADKAVMTNMKNTPKTNC
jgi:hypothetical protein